LIPNYLKKDIQDFARNIAEAELNSEPCWDKPIGQLELFPYRKFIKSEPAGRVVVIDGSDRSAFEYRNGAKGASLYRWGYLIVDANHEVLYRNISNINLVPVRTLQEAVDDLVNFYWANFGNRPLFKNEVHGIASSVTVRQIAALYRQASEFLAIKDILDKGILSKGDIIILDGFLKANFIPRPDWIDDVAQRCVRRGITLIGIAKNCKLDVTREFTEIWRTEGDTSAWFKVAAERLYEAYRPHGQFVTIGPTGRGVGIPMGVCFSPLRRSWYAVDFNCHDLESLKIAKERKGEKPVYPEDVCLTPRDKDYITQTLQKVAHYTERITSLGYPFPGGKVHKEVLITSSDEAYVRDEYKSEWLKYGFPMQRIAINSEPPHKIVEG
jgi:hypothetical protein